MSNESFDGQYTFQINSLFQRMDYDLHSRKPSVASSFLHHQPVPKLWRSQHSSLCEHALKLINSWKDIFNKFGAESWKWKENEALKDEKNADEADKPKIKARLLRQINPSMGINRGRRHSRRRHDSNRKDLSISDRMDVIFLNVDGINCCVLVISSTQTSWLTTLSMDSGQIDSMLSLFIIELFDPSKQ